jgi:hypothetical protein
MNFRTKTTAAIALALLAVSTLPAAAFPFGKKKPQDTVLRKPSAAQNALIDKSIVREKAVVTELKKRSPLVETYIQNMKPDPIYGQAPESDVHFLGRVNFGKVINDAAYETDKRDTGGKFGFMKHSLGYITGLSASLHLTFHESGFVQMLLVDSNSFNRQTYTFSFVRNDFLGTVKTVVFDVQPTKKGARGRFAGRIWVEVNNGNIVRFNGDFAGSEQDITEYYHFDSWRTNVADNLWLPTSIYVEESDPKSPTHVLKFKAINHVWGYELKIPPPDSDQTSVDVVGADDKTANSDVNDVSPLGAQREWIQQAEDNVVGRLFTAGLIDAPSPFDKTLEQIANNILAYNQIPAARPIRVRTLLTEPLESLSIGNTILLSKSLIDTTAVPSTDGQQAQQLGDLNAIIAFQVAHIILGHHIDTKYAFSDRLLFPNESAFHRLPMHHTDADNAAAAKKAVELLQESHLSDSQGYFGLYLQQLATRSKTLKALNEPMIGDGLLKPDGTFWLQALVGKAPKLNVNDMKQQAAMPLSSFLKFDPWTDQLVQLRTVYEPLQSARDRYAFEVLPVYMRLSYWKPADVPPPAAAAPAADPNAAPATAPATTAPAADPTAPTAAPATTTPPASTTAPAPTM